MTDYNVANTSRFLVEIYLPGLSSVGGFSEVSGIEAEIEYEEFNEGGRNDTTYYFPKRTKHSRLVLKRGVFDSVALFGWFESAVQGVAIPAVGSIILLHPVTGKEVCRWSFTGAVPAKWSGPSFNATSAGVAIETLELVYQELVMIPV